MNFTAIITAIALLFGNFLALFVPAAPQTGSIDSVNAQMYIEKLECADEIYVVEGGNINENEWDTLVCLQGLVNKKEPKLYVVYSDAYNKYLNMYENAGKRLVRKNSNGKEWTLAFLIEEFKPFITDCGYTLYRDSELGEGVNVACNYATAKGWLAVNTELKDFAENLGLTCKLDISKDTYNYSFQKKHYKALKSCFKTNAIVHVKGDVQGLRDLAIEQNFWITFSEVGTVGESFLKSILNGMGTNIAVFGWGDTEIHFVRFLSKLGDYVIPMDHSRNNSYMANFTFDSIKQKKESADITADPSKHYMAIVFSDGDNSQWIQNGYAEYYEKLEKYNTFKMTWTFPLIQQELSQASIKMAYDAGDDKNYFIGGVSGIGYINPSVYSGEELDNFTTYTAAACQRSDMRVVTILDSIDDTFRIPRLEKTFAYYTRFDNIDGAIVMLDPNKYAAAGGKVWFRNDKPLISVRHSLWYSNNESRILPEGWIEEQLEICNSFEADITSINGYSVVNVHPWSVSVGDLSKFVEGLDEHIELVTVDELIKLVGENVPHTDCEVNK